MLTRVIGADPGFEKGGGAEGWGGSSQNFFGQFRTHFKESESKKGGRAPPLWIRA